MIIGLNAGHCLKGSVGARGIVASGKEEVETREIANLVRYYAEKLGHTVINCTVDEATNNADLDKIVALANKQKLDIFVSIHLNSYWDKTVGGTETWIAINQNGMYASQQSYEKNYNIAKKVNDKVANSCNFKNRGVKHENFKVLTGVKYHAILVECCFISSELDKKTYNADKIAKAIVEGLTGETIKDEPIAENKTGYYRVIAGSFKEKSNALKRKNELEKLGISSFLEFK